MLNLFFARGFSFMTDLSDLSRLEPKNGDFIRYVERIVSRQQQEMLQARGDEASALRESLKSAFQAIETPDKDGDGVSLRDLVSALAGKNTRTQKQHRPERSASKASFDPIGKVGGLLSYVLRQTNELPKRVITNGKEQEKALRQSQAQKETRSQATARIAFLERFLGVAALLAAFYISELGITLPGSFVRAGDLLIAIAVLLFFHAGILSKRG